MLSKYPALLLPAALLAFMPARGPAQPNPAVPLVQAGANTETPSDALRTLAAAQRAQELGLPSEAVNLYRKLLAFPPGSGGDRAKITLALTSALLADGDIAGAEQALLAQPETLRGSAWHLRAGLIAAYQKKPDTAKTELAAVKRDELGADDAGWWFFLQGMLSNIAGDLKGTFEFYGQAAAAAQSEMPRARFRLAQDQARLKVGTVSEKNLEDARKTAEEHPGMSIGYGNVRSYAIMLDVFGRKGDAIAVLQPQLRGLPASERAEADELRLLLGLIAGAGNGVGRNELSQLLANGSDAEKQRIALMLLANASRTGPAKVDFRRQLGELIGAPRPHRILEDLLVMRAQVALADADYPQAEADAKALLEKFPGSQLKPQALTILTSAAMERGYYHNAADFATRARDELRRPDDRQLRANLGLLIAEAYFRAEDFRNAAEAYSAVLKEPPEGVAKGGLMFQRVQSAIKAANFDGPRLQAIEPLLDELARDPAFDPVNRWSAEWYFAQALMVVGETETKAAYARVNQLLAAVPPKAVGSGPVLPADLRARLEWLRTKLALQTGQPEQTLKLADGLTSGLDALDPKMRMEIASSMVLLKAQANFALGREPAAMEALDKLRAGFPGSNATIYSYFIEADYNDRQDKTAAAQKALNKMADDFPQSPYRPYALYRVALLEERRGQEANLKQANNLIEKLIPTLDAQSELVFAARYEQGQLLRRLNEFPSAQRTYEAIITAFPQHRGIEEVKLALADCHAAQAAGDEAHADRAKEAYERLLALPTASPDVRIEAGYQLGKMLIEHPDTRRAEDVWWQDVVHQFLLDKPEAAAQLGTTGPYWMSRTLLEFGELAQKKDRLDEAKTAWSLIRQYQLPMESAAREKLGAKPLEPAP